MLVARAWVAAAAIAVATAIACGEESDGPASTCGGVARAALVNGSVSELFLGLGDAEVRAIVLLEGAADDAFCSGTLVADGWVLTAAHCTKLVRPELTVTTAGGTRLRLPVLETLVHPQLDAALFRSYSIDECAGIEPLPPFEGSIEPAWTGMRVELSGYGLTERAENRALQFLVESIATVESEFLIVDGAGRSGACLGDSGGPLLIRDGAGVASVAGLLTSGSSSCVNRDRFVRVDALRDWLATVLDPPPVGPRGCGELTHSGTCTHEGAAWCDERLLEHERCGEGFGCGWDDRERGFRCVKNEDDPCEGAGPHGACKEGHAVVCEAGTLVRTPCAEAGLECGYAPESGVAECADP